MSERTFQLLLAWVAAVVMARSRWVVRAPRTAVLIWQAVALTGSLLVGMTHGPATLSSALRRFRAGDRLPTPLGTLGGTEGGRPPRPAHRARHDPVPAACPLLPAALTVAGTPLSLFLLPL